MDNVDKSILDLLQECGNMRPRDIGEKLAISRSQASARIRKLERSGMIKHYTALLNPDLAGKNILVFINIWIKEYDADSRVRFVKLVEKLEAVMEFFQISGHVDFLIKARFSDMQSFQNFLTNELACIPNVRKIESQIALEEIKCSTKIVLSH